MQVLGGAFGGMLNRDAIISYVASLLASFYFLVSF